ncbi:MAG: hypothetical protein J7576_13540 [Siphonobacter aquaeclarae]|nr:hypothetical protein [Siphonobacter aquaeclarae]
MEQRAWDMGWFAGVVMRSSLPGWLSPVEATRRNSFPAKKEGKSTRYAGFDGAQPPATAAWSMGQRAWGLLVW